MFIFTRLAFYYAHHVRTVCVALLLLACGVQSGFAQEALFGTAIEALSPSPYLDGVGRAVHQNRDGTIVVIGATQNANMLQFNHVSQEGQVLLQNIIWEDPGFDPWSVHQGVPGDDGYVVVGATTYGGSGKALIVKLSTAGVPLWHFRLSTVHNSDYRCVEVLSNGDYMAVGSEETSDPNISYVILSRFSPGGTLQWTQRLTMSSANDCDLALFRGYSLRECADGSLVITGFGSYNCMGVGFEAGVLLAKVSATAPVTVAWSQIYHATNLMPCGLDVRETCDGGFLVCGRSNLDINLPQDGFALRTDPTGMKIWSNVIGSQQSFCQFYGVEETEESGAMLFGGTFRFSGQTNRILGTRLSNSGAIEWSGTWTHGKTSPSSHQFAYDMERS